MDHPQAVFQRVDLAEGRGVGGREHVGAVTEGVELSEEVRRHVEGEDGGARALGGVESAYAEGLALLEAQGWVDFAEDVGDVEGELGLCFGEESLAQVRPGAVEPALGREFVHFDEVANGAQVGAGGVELVVADVEVGQDGHCHDRHGVDSVGRLFDVGDYVLDDLAFLLVVFSFGVGFGQGCFLVQGKGA